MSFYPLFSSLSVVFAGFSSDALSDRINDAKSKVVITADEVILLFTLLSC